MEGNQMKMREALEKIYSLAQDICDYKDETVIVRHRADLIKRAVNAAISAPARNCDMPYNDRVEMYGAFKDWCKAKGHTMEPMLAYDAFDWLLAPAAERKGEGDGR